MGAIGNYNIYWASQIEMQNRLLNRAIKNQPCYCGPGDTDGLYQVYHAVVELDSILKTVCCLHGHYFWFEFIVSDFTDVPRSFAMILNYHESTSIEVLWNSEEVCKLYGLPFDLSS